MYKPKESGETHMTQFADVKQVLDGIMAGWTNGNNNVPPDLSVHGNTFLLDTREHLLAAEAFGFKLIQDELIGQAGKGQTANIVVALTNPDGVNQFGEMPLGGLDSKSGVFLTLDSPEVKTIIDWIEGGCLP
jgi:hypothetical protein